MQLSTWDKPFWPTIDLNGSNAGCLRGKEVGLRKSGADTTNLNYVKKLKIIFL